MANLEALVTVILDETYGFRAIEAAKHGAIWLVRSPKNEDVAKDLWRKYEDREGHITLLEPSGEMEQTCLDIIPDVDLHHPELSELIVVGVKLTPDMRVKLAERVRRETDDGFVLGPSDDF